MKKQIFMFVVIMMLVLTSLPLLSTAGGGSVRKIEDDGPAYGAIDLTVNLLYEPESAEEVESLKKYFITGSSIMCDSTEEYFRFGTITFTRNLAGKQDADIWISKEDGRPYSQGVMTIGKRGTHIQLFHGVGTAAARGLRYRDGQAGVCADARARGVQLVRFDPECGRGDGSRAFH